MKVTKTTVAWRLGILGLMASAIPLGFHASEGRRAVDTDAMLDVSVSIKTYSHVRTDEVGDSVWTSGDGSGFLVSTDTCEVWTAQHVVADAAIVEVHPRGWSRDLGISATVVNGSPRSDIALLRMNHCEGLVAARFGDSAAVRPGDESYAVGNPLGHNPDSISRGIISHAERYVMGAVPYLQTDAAINPGNSGGALFNRRGEVIGINSAIATTERGSSLGIGYAIPINVARKVTDRLREGPPSWGDVGIADRLSPLTADQAAMFGVPDGLEAVSLARAPTEGPATEALRARDVIFRIAGRPVEGPDHANRLVNQAHPGDLVRFDLVRDGEIRAVDITVAEGWKPADPPSPDPYVGYLGLALEMWADGDRERDRFEHPVITRIYGLGPAHRGHVTSSQHAVGVRGPFVVSFQLDVKTVTGVVYEGDYHPVRDVESVERFAAAAYERDAPILLEIETWGRPHGVDPGQPLRHLATRFHKLRPALSGAGDAVDFESWTRVLEEPTFAPESALVQIADRS